MVLYFHGNAEDIGNAFELLNNVGASLGLHVLAVEYPGYGLYKGSRPDEMKMRVDADTIFDFITRVVGVRQEDIIIWGRSLGSGPACYLASRRSFHSLFLMSAYTSIRDVARSMFGLAGSLVSSVVVERFENK